MVHTFMATSERKVVLNLSEHDAARLLSLIRKEMDQENKVWRSYWERLAQIIEQDIELSAKIDLSQYSGYTKKKKSEE